MVNAGHVGSSINYLLTCDIVRSALTGLELNLCLRESDRNENTTQYFSLLIVFIGNQYDIAIWQISPFSSLSISKV